MALFGGLGSVGDVRWFCRGDEDWLSMAERLKLTPCPHCNIVGTLIQHGYLRGYDDSNLKQKAVRARRIFCSNRNNLTQPAIDLIVRSADGVLRQARNLCVGCMIEAVRSANRTIDIDNVNRVLMQPHWQKEADLVDY